MKRYAIVRVDHSYCPIIEEYTKGCYCPQDKDRDFYCSDCKTFKNYGDTKEQLIKKVAQVLFKGKLEIYKNVYGIIPNDKFMKDIYIKQLEVAKEIVEFLGVEE